MGIILKKCPLCGGEIVVSYICQYSRVYKLAKSGRISRRYTIVDSGTMDVAVASCDCGANWNKDQFVIDENGYFIDYKYGGEHDT